ncbi:MAG TPA: hypothetical protein V6C81_14625 [Planktothrix sp.]|jgi:hypothetical protein
MFVFGKSASLSGVQQKPPLVLRRTVQFALLSAALAMALPAWCQGVPLPGDATMSAPVPGNDSWENSLMPNATGVSKQAAGMHAAGIGYGDLPLNADDAKARIIEMRGMLKTTRPQEMATRINQLCEWLSDMVDAHTRMANAFSRSPATKAQMMAEHQTAQRFSQLKDSAQLLKADQLISMRRFPEAIGPLVEIVIAEPTSATGQGAYKRLKDLGFSPDAATTAATPASTPAAAPAEIAPKKTASVPAAHK